MPFVQFIPESETKGIQASLTPKGILFLANDLLENCGFAKASHVFLFFDPERRALGLRPADSSQPGAVKLARRKRGAVVRVGELLNFYRLVVEGKLLLEAHHDEKENLLVLPLLGARMRPGRRPLVPRAVRPQPARRAAATASTAPAAAPRRRGRSPKQAAAPEVEAPARGRGRPPKASALEAEAVPRRRGRPPKAVPPAMPEAPARRRGRPSKAAAASRRGAPSRSKKS